MRSHWQTWGRFRGVAGREVQKWGKGKLRISRVKLVHYLCSHLHIIFLYYKGEMQKLHGGNERKGSFSSNNFFNNTLHLPVAVDFCKRQLMFFNWHVHFSEDTVNPIKLSLAGHWTSLCFHIHHVQVLPHTCVYEHANHEINEQEHQLYQKDQ